MHIGMFAPSLAPENAANGIVTYVRIMRAALIAAGHRVSVFDGHRVLRSDGNLEPLRALGRVKAKLRAVRETLHARPDDPIRAHDVIAAQARRIHRQDPLDILEIEESFGWSSRMRLPFPIVIRLHGPHFLGKDDVEPADAARASIDRIAAEAQGIRSADALTSPSHRLLEATLAAFPTQSAIVETIPNPIAAAPATRRWTRSQSDLNQILCVGRFDRRKGADIVLAAFAAAARKCPAIRLVLVGPDTGVTLDSGERLHFAAYCKAHLPAGLHDRIVFTGPLPAAEVEALRLRSGLAIVASRFENFPYSVAESMAIGAPIIVSDSFGNGEMIIDGTSGLVVPVGDVAALAAAIVTLIRNPDRAAALGDAAYQRCRVWLNPGSVAAATLSVYARALAAR